MTFYYSIFQELFNDHFWIFLMVFISSIITSIVHPGRLLLPHISVWFCSLLVVLKISLWMQILTKVFILSIPFWLDQSDQSVHNCNINKNAFLRSWLFSTFYKHKLTVAIWIFEGRINTCKNFTWIKICLRTKHEISACKSLKWVTVLLVFAWTHIEKLH